MVPTTVVMVVMVPGIIQRIIRGMLETTVVIAVVLNQTIRLVSVELLVLPTIA
jgi:hypothetical protein